MVSNDTVSASYKLKARPGEYISHSPPSSFERRKLSTRRKMLVVVLVAAALVAGSSAWPPERFPPTSASLQGELIINLSL